MYLSTISKEGYLAKAASIIPSTLAMLKTTIDAKEACLVTEDKRPGTRLQSKGILLLARR